MCKSSIKDLIFLTITCTFSSFLITSQNCLAFLNFLCILTILCFSSTLLAFLPLHTILQFYLPSYHYMHAISQQSLPSYHYVLFINIPCIFTITCYSSTFVAFLQLHPISQHSLPSYDYIKLSKPQLNHNSTQPNLTLSWVRHENDFAHPTPPPPHKLNVSNITGVTDPILMKL